MTEFFPARAASTLALLLVGCEAEPPGEPTPEPGSGAVELGPERRCAEPYSGFDRLREDGLARGLTEPYLDPGTQGRESDWTAPLVAEDFDGDGDVDLLAGRFDGLPTLYLNDGGGRFEVAPPLFEPVIDRWEEVEALGAADLDDDGLPEVLLGGIGFVARAHNLGGGTFAEPELLWRVPEGEHLPSVASLSVGDADGDGDLDLALATSFLVPAGSTWPPDPENPPWGGDPPPAAADLLLLQGPDGWTRDRELLVRGEAAPGQLVHFTDFDGDGDLDLLLATDQGRQYRPNALFRNEGNDADGRPVLVDVAEAMEADLRMSAMGLDSADFDQDGLLDYCMTDVGPPRCLFSAGGDAFVEAGPGFGLSPSAAPMPTRWSGWSFELVDLDADGDLDAVASGGDPGEGEATGLPDDPTLLDHPNALWQGTSDGALLRFVDRTEELGFGSPRDDYGLVAADFDGDGFRDVAIFGTEGTPALWMNRCSDAAWLLVELVGSEGNRPAFGARVEVDVDGRTRLREVSSVRTQGQGPSRVHFGLGDAERADLVVHWPGGGRTTVRDLPLRRRVTIRAD